MPKFHENFDTKFHENQLFNQTFTRINNAISILKMVHLNNKSKTCFRSLYHCSQLLSLYNNAALCYNESDLG